MVTGVKGKEGLKMLISAKTAIATYFEWEIYINLLAKPDPYDGNRIPGLFIGKRMVEGKVTGGDIKGATLIDIRKKVDAERTTNLKFRNKCKALTTDNRKCDYCGDRFICFTQK